MRSKLSKLVLEYELVDIEKIEKKIPKIEFHKQETIIKNKDKILIIPPKNITCIYCNSTYFVKGGMRYNKNCKVQRYHCRNCKKAFSFRGAFGKQHASPNTIIQAMELYFTGESLRGIATFLQLQGVSITYTTVSNWIKKYIKLMKVFLDQFTPKVSDKWRCDEIYVKIRGNPKWLFVLMDDETRFILAYYIADTKKTHNANRLLQIAVTKAQKKPKLLTTDGLGSYKKAFDEVFGADPMITHLRATYSHHNKWENNLMERFNGTFRHRQKTLRGIKTKDSIFFDGFMIWYNFIREHTAIKDTPASLAGIEIQGNKWLTIIENAQREQCQN